MIHIVIFSPRIIVDINPSNLLVSMRNLELKHFNSNAIIIVSEIVKLVIECKTVQ